MTVALSWGNALQSMVYAATADRDYAINLVQLVGGLSSVTNAVSGSELVRELAVRLGASYRLLLAPAALGSSVAVEALMAETSIAQALEEARAADMAFVGIGTSGHGSSAAVVASLGPDGQGGEGLLGGRAGRRHRGSVLQRLQAAPIHGPVEDRMVAVTLEDLSRIPNVVGVAYGRAKTPGVLGALRGHHIDSLICDETLARSLLSEGRALPHADLSRGTGT